MPSGYDLKDRIAPLLDLYFDHSIYPTKGDARIAECMRLRAPGNAFNQLLYKAWAIRDGLPLALSIDNYLDAHRGDADVEYLGKLGIVAAIIEAESRSHLRARGEQSERPFPIGDLTETWYVKFAQLLTENVAREDIGAAIDRVSVINFNYDRTLEHFLLRALMVYYQMSENEARPIVGRLIVRRPYGGLGPLPWQDPHSLAFGDVRSARLAQLSQLIRTFGERIEEGEELAALRDMMAGAQTIVFLGFGFHRQNIRLLTPTDGPGPNAAIYASRRGISENNWAAIHAALSIALSSSGGPGRIGGNPAIFGYEGSCAALMDEYRWSLTE